MNRPLLFIALITFFCQGFCRTAQAQYKADAWIFSTKISFADYSDKNHWDGYSIRKIPPIDLSLEKGITPFFSAGGYLGYYGNKYTNDTLTMNVISNNTFAIGALGTIHYAHWIEAMSHYKIFLGDFDFYVSGALHMDFNHAKREHSFDAEGQLLPNTKDNTVDLQLRPIFGMRYFVSDYFCMLLEIGKGNLGMITTGVSWQITP